MEFRYGEPITGINVSEEQMPSVNRKVIANHVRTFGDASGYTNAVKEDRSFRIISGSVNKIQAPMFRLYRAPILAEFYNRFDPYTPRVDTGGGGGGGGPAPEPPEPTPSFTNLTVVAQTGITHTSVSWRTAASSSDGNTIMVGSTGASSRLWLGARSGTGASFTIVWQELASGPTTRIWGQSGLAMSASGSRLLGTSGTAVHYSVDGAAWSSATITGVTLGPAVCTPLADTVLVGGRAGKIWRGTLAAGAYTFTELSSSPSQSWNGIGISSDGTRMVGVANSANGVWTSANSGASWTQLTGFTTPNEYYNVAMSADGATIYVAPNGFPMKGVFNGTTWTFSTLTSAISSLWTSVACSADGTAVLFGSYGGGLYWSSDGGTTFSNQTVSGQQFWDIAMSSNGGKVLIGAESGSSTKPYAGAFY